MGDSRKRRREPGSNVVAGLHPRHKIDISTRDLLLGLAACASARSPRREEVAVLRSLPMQEEVLACLSVRSGFDLLLAALSLPPGSELVVSAVTHPDMVRIVEAHGLVPCPADLDLETLAPRPEAVERAVTPRTRAIVVAHLFGGRVDLEPLATVARRHRLLLVEDCAQAFRGPLDASDSRADVSLFSFGSIKTATALGGALVRVRDPALRERMRALHDEWPRRPNAEYAAKILKFLALAAIAEPRAYARATRHPRFDDLLGRAVRGFDVAGDEFFRRIRTRPSPALLALLAHRLRTFDRRRLARRAAAGEELARALPGPLFHPGSRALAPTHWVFPVVAPDRGPLIEALAELGFDAARATTGIGVVDPPAGRDDLEPENARRMMRDIVFLPAYPEIPVAARRRLARALAARYRTPVPAATGAR